MTKETLDILMVEDDRDTSEIIIDTARLCKSSLRWEVVEDGEKALAYVRGHSPFNDRPRPSLVLLDLRLPKLGGVDVLREMRHDRSLRSLPVIIMSNSREQADIDAAYALGANCYMGKPNSFEGLCSMVKFLEAFLTLPRPPQDSSVEAASTLPAHSIN